MKRLRLSRRPAAPRGGRGFLRFYLSAGAVLIVAFLIGLYLFFPATALKERIENEVASRAPVSLNIGHLALRFPPGLSGSPVTVTIVPPFPPRPGDPPPAEIPPFRFDRVQVSPAWGTLFGSHPGAAFQASLLGGELAGVLQRGGAVDAVASGLRWSGPLGATSLQLTTTLKSARFVGGLPLRATTATRLEATLSDVRLTGLKALGGENDSLALGTVVLRASGRGNSFRIESLDATGGSLGASVSGTVLLMNPVERSRINLSVTLRPAASFDKNLASLLNLVTKPERDGTYRLHLTGSVGRPQNR